MSSAFSGLRKTNLEDEMESLTERMDKFEKKNSVHETSTEKYYTVRIEREIITSVKGQYRVKDMYGYRNYFVLGIQMETTAESESASKLRLVPPRSRKIFGRGVS